MIRVFLGYDSGQTVGYHVACNSIHRLSSRPVAVAPLMLSQLAHVFDRPRDPRQSTEFSFTRFLVPYLCDYAGWAIYADCDIVLREDIAALWAMRDERYAVQVVKHVHVPTSPVKFLGRQQSIYARKNWSSVMLLNNARCRALTPDYVRYASGLDLHQFRWLAGDEEIGALPETWNHLVESDPAPAATPAVLHYTEGGPWFEAYRDSAHATEWWSELARALQPVPADEMTPAAEPVAAAGR